jgi:hypothetical protein
MNINFTKSFSESLKTLYWQNTLPYKAYSFFRYDFPRFLKNIWKFRKALYNYYWFDHHGTLMFMETGLTDMANKIEKHGTEATSSRLKKVEKMHRVIQLIKNYNEDLYIEMAEKELGEVVLHELEFEPSPDHPGSYQLVDKNTQEENEHNRKVFDRAREIGEQEWNELWDIIKGQDYSKFDKNIDFDNQFDGSGLRGWWD